MMAEVLLFDEFSMMDEQCWSSVEEILSVVDDSKRPAAAPDASRFGNLHVALFGTSSSCPRRPPSRPS